MTAIACPTPRPAARAIALPAYTRWLLALATAVAAGLLLAPSLLAPASGEPSHTPAIASALAPAALSSATAPAATPVWVAPQPAPVAPSLP